MDLKDKIKPYVVGAGLAMGLAGAMTGCATSSIESQVKSPDKQYTKTQEAMDILGADSPADIYTLPGGYKTHDNTVPLLRRLAGIAQGDIEVKKTEEGLLMRGTYSEVKNPEPLEIISRKAAGVCDEDNYITSKEAKIFEQAFYKWLGY